MTRRHRNTEPVSVQEERLSEPPKQVVTDGNEQAAPSVKKKRVRHRQTVKLHNKKLSVAVICANPYLRQFL